MVLSRSYLSILLNTVDPTPSSGADVQSDVIRRHPPCLLIRLVSQGYSQSTRTPWSEPDRTDLPSDETRGDQSDRVQGGRGAVELCKLFIESLHLFRSLLNRKPRGRKVDWSGQLGDDTTSCRFEWHADETRLTEVSEVFPSILSNLCLSNMHSDAAGVMYNPLTAWVTPVMRANPAVDPQKDPVFIARRVCQGACLKLEMRAGRSLISRVKRPRAPSVE